MARLGGRAVLWLFWGLSTASGCLFVILGLVAFADVAQVQHEPSAGDFGSQLDGVLAGTLMASVLTAMLLVASFMILVKKTWALSGTGLSYGFLAASYFYMTSLLILTGVTMTSAKHYTSTFEQSSFWSTSSTSAYVGAYVLAFITSGFFLAMFAEMIGPGRHAVRGQVTVDELGLSDRLRNPNTPLSVGMTSAASRAQPPAGPADSAGAERSAGAWGP